MCSIVGGVHSRPLLLPTPEMDLRSMKTFVKCAFKENLGRTANFFSLTFPLQPDSVRNRMHTQINNLMQVRCRGCFSVNNLIPVQGIGFTSSLSRWFSVECGSPRSQLVSFHTTWIETKPVRWNLKPLSIVVPVVNTNNAKITMLTF